MQKHSRNFIPIVIGTIALSMVSVAIGALNDGLSLSVESKSNRIYGGNQDIVIDISDFFDVPDKGPNNTDSSDISAPNVSDSINFDKSNTETASTESVNAFVQKEKKELTENDIKLSLLYNNSYSEKVLIEGETLGVEVTVPNDAQCDGFVVIVAFYSNGQMIDVNMLTYEESTVSDTGFVVNAVVPDENDITNAKIFVFESIQTISPICPAIELTKVECDYYGDTYLTAQSISRRNSANGRIDTENDADVFSFVPQNDGLYFFETFSDVDTYAVLYDSENMEVPVASGDNEGVDNNFRLTKTLQAGETYYLYVYGREVGNYILNYGYAVGDVFGTVGPVKYCDDDMIFNEEIETTIKFKTYHSGEYVATLHLKDWCQSNAEYTSYSVTGIHSGEYIVEISRPGYITYFEKIQLKDNTIDMGNIELIPGDVDSDGVVDSDDLTIISESLGACYGDENYCVSADFNGNKVIDAEDLLLVEVNQNKTSNSYDQNIVVPTLDIAVEDIEMTVFGTAKPEIRLNCNIYLDTVCLYEESVVCNAEGSYVLTAELNRSGQYYVEVYYDTPVLAIGKMLNFD